MAHAIFHVKLELHANGLAFSLILFLAEFEFYSCSSCYSDMFNFYQFQLKEAIISLIILAKSFIYLVRLWAQHS